AVLAPAWFLEGPCRDLAAQAGPALVVAWAGPASVQERRGLRRGLASDRDQACQDCYLRPCTCSCTLGTLPEPDPASPRTSAPARAQYSPAESVQPYLSFFRRRICRFPSTSRVTPLPAAPRAVRHRPPGRISPKQPKSPN